MENLTQTTKTIQYYDKNASSFAKDTVNADMHVMQDWFLSYLKQDSTILDLGCGTGRDARYFLGKGYKVTATDGSVEMCKIARENIGIDVRQLLFSDIDYVDAFDGIWACASLLHVPFNDLTDVLIRIGNALKPDGIFYTSFKKGTFQGDRNGRYYTDLTEMELIKLLADTGYFAPIEIRTTSDVRVGRNDIWLNVVAKRI